MKKRYLLLLLFTTSVGGFAKATSENHAADSLYKWERFSVNFGVFVAGLSSDLSLGSKDLGLGLNINLEDALGLETSSFVARGEVEYTFGKSLRHTGRFSYYGFLRNSRKVLEKTIEIGGIEFDAGTDVQSKYNMEIFKLDYAYALYTDKRVKINSTIGFFVMPINFQVSAGEQKGTSAIFIAPLPVLGLRTNFAVTPKFHLMQNIEVFYLKVGSFSGSMVDVNIRAEYNLWEHFGVGLGVNNFQLSVTKKKADSVIDFEGSIKTGYTGLLLYVKYFF